MEKGLGFRVLVGGGFKMWEEMEKSKSKDRILQKVMYTVTSYSHELQDVTNYRDVTHSDLVEQKC